MGRVVWITISGHYRTFKHNIKNLRSFLDTEPSTCRVLVLFTRNKAEAPGKAWWGERNNKNVNKNVHVVESLQNISKHRFTQNFFWVVTRTTKSERFADLEVMSYLFAKRLRAFHDAFCEGYGEWLGHEHVSQGDLDDSKVILGARSASSNLTDGFEAARKHVFTWILCNALQTRNKSAPLRYPFLTDHSNQIERLQKYCLPPSGICSYGARTVEHIFMRTRPDVLYTHGINYGQIASAMRKFRNAFRKQKLKAEPQTSEEGTNWSSILYIQEPVVVFGYVVLHNGSQIWPAGDPSEVFYVGSEAYFDSVYAPMISNKAWPNFVWPNLLWGPSEALIQHREHTVGGVFTVPKTFTMWLHRATSGTSNCLNCYVLPDPVLQGKDVRSHVVSTEIADFTRDAMRLQKIPKKMNLKKIMEGDTVPSTRENLTEPDRSILF